MSFNFAINARLDRSLYKRKPIIILFAKALPKKEFVAAIGIAKHESVTVDLLGVLLSDTIITEMLDQTPFKLLVNQLVLLVVFYDA